MDSSSCLCSAQLQQDPGSLLDVAKVVMDSCEFWQVYILKQACCSAQVMQHNKVVESYGKKHILETFLEEVVVTEGEDGWCNCWGSRIAVEDGVQ